jgi:hypothetical protein
MVKVGKKVSTFTRTRRFSTAFTKAWSLKEPWVRRIQSPQSRLTDFHFIIILLLTLRSSEKLHFCDPFLMASKGSSYNFRELGCNAFPLQNTAISSSSTFGGHGTVFITFSSHSTSRMTSVRDVIYSWLDGLPCHNRMWHF